MLSDNEEPFAPLPPGAFLIKAADRLEQLDGLLDMLTERYVAPGPPPRGAPQQLTCAGAALHAAADALSGTGGRVQLIFSSLPSTGKGKLQRRESTASYGSPGAESEQALLRPAPGSELYQASLASKSCSSCTTLPPNPRHASIPPPRPPPPSHTDPSLR